MITDDYHHHKFSFREFIGTKAECGPNDCHWNPQFDEVEDWTITNHAANFKDLANGTEWVLRNLGGNTWEKNGATGQGTNGHSAMLKENVRHSSSAQSKFNQCCAPEL